MGKRGTILSVLDDPSRSFFGLDQETPPRRIGGRARPDHALQRRGRKSRSRLHDGAARRSHQRRNGNAVEERLLCPRASRNLRRPPRALQHRPGHRRSFGPPVPHRSQDGRGGGQPGHPRGVADRLRHAPQCRHVHPHREGQEPAALPAVGLLHHCAGHRRRARRGQRRARPRGKRDLQGHQHGPDQLDPDGQGRDQGGHHADRELPEEQGPPQGHRHRLPQARRAHHRLAPGRHGRTRGASPARARRRWRSPSRATRSTSATTRRPTRGRSRVTASASSAWR